MNRFIFAFVTAIAFFVAITGSAQAAPIPIVGARLTPSKTSEGIRWDARYIVDLDVVSSPQFEGGVIDLAAPLPTEVRLEPRAGLQPLVDSRNHIIAIFVEPAGLRDRTIDASFVAPNVSESAPIARGSSVQIIEAPQRMILEVLPLHGFEKHVGYVAPRGISHSAREEARRLTETPVRISQTLIYVRGDDIQPDVGFKTKLVDQRERTRSGSIGVGLLFAGLVGALVIAARRLRHSASVERADRILKAEIDGLRSKGRV
jgi:hypothetical protein